MRNHLAIEDDIREVATRSKDHEESLATLFKRLEQLERRFADHLGEDRTQAEAPRRYEVER